MKRKVSPVAAALAAAFAALSLVSMTARAQSHDESQEGTDAPASTDWALTANVSLVNEYRFRGITQTFGLPAVQGGFDLAMPHGFYIGNWNSNVESGAGYPGGSLESDLYGGWKYSFNADTTTDTGILAYLYPGSKGSSSTGPYVSGNAAYGGVKSGMVNNIEYYIGVTWKTITLKENIALSDYFGQISSTGAATSGTSYTDLTATQDLGFINDKWSTWGVIGHVGYLAVHNYSAANYVDWKLGITKDLGSGWTASLAYIQTNAKGDCGKAMTETQPYCQYKTWDTNGNVSGTPRNLGNATGVIQITKTF